MVFRVLQFSLPHLSLRPTGENTGGTHTFPFWLVIAMEVNIVKFVQIIGIVRSEKSYPWTDDRHCYYAIFGSPKVCRLSKGLFLFDWLFPDFTLSARIRSRTGVSLPLELISGVFHHPTVCVTIRADPNYGVKFVLSGSRQLQRDSRSPSVNSRRILSTMSGLL